MADGGAQQLGEKAFLMCELWVTFLSDASAFYGQQKIPGDVRCLLVWHVLMVLRHDGDVIENHQIGA